MPQSLYWDCETRSTVDLRKTGVYIYAAHPSTSVTVARLALGDEPPCEWRPPAPQINSVVPCYRGSRCSWPGCAPDCDGRPGLPARPTLPQKYLDALADPDVRVVAHNAAFERIILLLILHPRYGWPTVPIERWACTMARARAQALPGALDGAAQAMGLDVRKDLQGHALMLRMCRPRAVLPGGDVTWWEDEERMARLSDYCSFDVRVERALDKGLRPLSDDEVNVWRETEIINDRGVRFDLDFVRAARVVGEDARVLLDEDMLRTTGGAVKKASNVTDLKRWLIRQNVDLTPPVYTTADPGIAAETQEEVEVDVEVLDEDVAAAGGTPDPRDDLPDLRRRDVLRLLAGELPGAARAALIVRYEAGKISTRKLDAIEHRADAEGVVRGLFGYHGANTGRYISHGLQVQNLPRDVPPDWDECRQLLDGGRELVDALWGPPLEMISRMLRGAIIPREGYEIGASDFSSVEAVGVAWLAGETSLLEAFRRREPIYEQMAAQVYGIPASRISKDSKERFVGKTCLGAGTKVLTDAGWINIERIKHNHRLWDGEQWVDHSGLINYGPKPTMTLSGVSLTADHRVWCATSWREAQYLARNENAPCLKLALASARLPSQATSLAFAEGCPDLLSDVIVAALNTLCSPGTLKWGGARDAIAARRKQHVRSDTGFIMRQCLTTAIERACSTASLLLSHAATVPAASTSGNMVFEGSPSTLPGGRTAALSFAMSRHCRGGTIPPWKWTAPTMIEDTSRAISGSRPDQKTTATSGHSIASSNGCSTWKPVYDLTNAGPRHRFTILTDDGPLIVSNCILGAGYQMGWFKFRETVLAQTGIYLSDEEAYRAIAVYRETFPNIPRLWREMNRAAISAVQLPGTVTHIGHIRFRREGKWLRMRLPSGRCIWYSQPLIEPNEKYGGEKLTYMEVNAKTRKWQRGQTYGGRLTENAVQGLCRDLLVHGMLGLERAGYRPIALVHDEIICEPPGFRGTIGEQIDIMCGAPDWAKGFPLSARGNRGLRYVK